MKSDYLVSICVPIYKVENYIERCVRSLFGQTYNNVEYIFIDDCSPDKSTQILQSILKEYPQREKQTVIIKHKKNRGLAAARNTGVQYAKGDFILWVDSDDYVSRDIVKELVEEQMKSNADIVSCNFYEVYPNQKKMNVWPDFSSPDEMIIQILQRKVLGFIWGRLIRRLLYVDNHISAIEGVNMGEDLQVMPILAYYSQRISRVNKSLYFYNKCNQVSYSNSYSFEKSKDSTRTFIHVYHFFSQKEKKYVKALEVMELQYISRMIINVYKSNMLDDKWLYVRTLQRRAQKKERNSWNLIPFSYRMVLIIKNRVFLKGYLKCSICFMNFKNRHA